MDEPVRVFDFERIFFGDLPLTFLLEIVFRTTVMFVYTLVIVRLVGKRGIGQFTPFEYVLIVALGSAVGDPMFYADVPLFHAMTVVTVIVALERLVIRLTERGGRLEAYVEGTPTRLVADGEVDLGALHKEGLSVNELREALRECGVENLGQVRRAYLEPSGKVSVFKYPEGEERDGATVLPDVVSERAPGGVTRKG